MFTLWKTFRFEAAHRLVDHDGKCARLHGHSWVFRLFVRGASLNESGEKRNMLIDYADIGAAGRAIVDLLDHQDMNEVLLCSMPTSEYLARYIMVALQVRLPGLAAVEVEETCTSGCRFEP